MQVKLNREKMGITCVENYLVWFLQNSGFKIENLYCDSYIEITKVINDFISGNVSYENYNGLTRLQNVGFDLDCLEMKFYRDLGYDDLINMIPKDNTFCLLAGMTPEFVKNIFKVMLWRDDHFIYIYNKTGNEINFLNDTPSLDVTCTQDEIRRNFNGLGILFSYKSDINQNFLFNKISELVERVSIPETIICNITEIPSLRGLRDAIGVLRISRRRIQNLSKIDLFSEYIKDYITFDNDLNELNNNLNSFYSLLEYYNLRNKYDLQKINEFLSLIYTCDNKWKKNIIRGI